MASSLSKSQKRTHALNATHPYKTDTLISVLQTFTLTFLEMYFGFNSVVNEPAALYLLVIMPQTFLIKCISYKDKV